MKNQRIERLWKDVYQGELAVFYQLFYFKEHEGILDSLNELHVAVLHLVFLHKFKKSLTCGIGLGHHTECTLLDHRLLKCGLLVNCKILWELNCRVRRLSTSELWS